MDNRDMTQYCASGIDDHQLVTAVILWEMASPFHLMMLGKLGKF